MSLNVVLFILLKKFFKCSPNINLTSKITQKCVCEITPIYAIMNGKYLSSLEFISIRVGLTMHVLSLKNKHFV